MWSQVFLCTLVGLVLATQSPGFNNNSEYVYEVRGKTLVSLHEVAEQYSGVLLKARLTLQPRNGEEIIAKLSNVQTAPVDSQPSRDWARYMEDSEVTYKNLPVTDKSFKIVMQDGVVRNLIVDKSMPEWEANIIKSIVSQLQLDTNGVNIIQDPINTNKDQTNNAVFKTLEDTITGITETLYDIHPLPRFIAESNPWIFKSNTVNPEDDIIEIVKTKNFTHSKNRPAYNHGLAGFGRWEPATNQLGAAITRSSMGYAVVTGKLNRYTIQHSSTVNKIIVNPTFDSKQHGSVESTLNMTLSSKQEVQYTLEDVPNPVKLGSLVYHYFSQKSENQLEDLENPMNRFFTRHRSTRAIGNHLQKNKVGSDESSENTSHNSKEDSSIADSSMSVEHTWTQEKPTINEPPKTPFLPFAIGYKGKSVKHAESFDVVEKAKEIAQQIGKDLDNIEYMPKQNTLNRFVILSMLAKIMNEAELHQVAGELYSNKQPNGPAHGAWIAFRDAVAEAGTGPALLTIQEWIQSAKINHHEAANVIETMAQATQQPTEEYMRKFFEMVKDPRIVNQPSLNETTLLAFASLARKVYVNEIVSHKEYPEHSFGHFSQHAGQQFLESEVIPYLSKHLNNAVAEADSHKIHVYIRALGNVGHKKILATFEPFLEGKRQVSQFQRLLMVLSMDKLSQASPQTAQSVLFRIYQNTGEIQEVRIAAVYQLMRTNPPTEMLQQMAEYTNIDTREHVNAAVKSAIESAAKLEGNDFGYLRSSAEAAKPLLTKKQYGHQYSQESLVSFVTKEMKNYYKQTVQSIVSETSNVPNYLRYSLRQKSGGFNSQLISLQGLVSNVNELVHVFEKQTKAYQQQKENQEQSQQSEKSQWSSNNIAKLLNMRSEEIEQLEGNLLLKIGDFHKLLTFDNHTIDSLPEYLQRIEQELKNAKEINQQKFIDRNPVIVAFPTEMGLPFVFKYNMPTLLSIQGHVKAQANPQVSDGRYLQKPNNVELEASLRAVISVRSQSQFEVITPFDHQSYSAGYDKNFQVHVPIQGKVNIDLVKKETKIELETIQPEQNAKLVHYSTWPYTTREDLLKPRPLAENENTRIIYQKTHHGIDYVFGQETTGFAIRVKGHTEQRFVDLLHYVKQLQSRKDLSLTNLWLEENLQHSQLDVEYVGQQSSNRKLKFSFDYEQNKFQNEDENNYSPSNVNVENLSELAADKSSRKQNFLQKAAAGIHRPSAHVLDSSVEFQGQRTVRFSATVAIAKSDIDSRSRLLAHLKQETSLPGAKQLQAGVIVVNDFPNTVNLNAREAMELNPRPTTKVQVAFGENLQSGSNINANVQWHKSEERKQYLLNLPMFQISKSQMQQGNYQLPPSANLTEEANIMDRINIKVSYENISPAVRNYTYKAYSSLLYMGYWNLDKNIFDQQNEISLETRFSPDFQSANVSIRGPLGKSTFDNVRVNEWTKRIFGVHPEFHLRSRLNGKLLGLQTYRPICVVDKTAANTFDNKTYPLTLNNLWTVMLQYVPQRAWKQQEVQTEQQLQKQLENYAVLVRENEQSEKSKEVKIIVAVPETQGQILEVALEPSQDNSQNKANVLIDGRKVEINKQQGENIKQGLVQIYALPNGEVKVEVRDAFYVIYDGARVKLAALNQKMRNSIRGLCGTFTGEQTTDFLTPHNCIVRDPREFIATYSVLSEGQQHQQVMDLKAKSQKNHCIYKTLPLYANVISSNDYEHEEKSDKGSSQSCSFAQSRYVHHNDKLCFTINPVFSCRKNCQQQGSVEAEVDAICMEPSKGQTWKKQIEQGRGVDFKKQKPNAQVKITYPRSCGL